MSRPCIVCPTPREVPCCLLSPRQSFRRPGVSQNSRQMLLFRDPVSKQLYGSSQRSIHVKHQYKSKINTRQRSIHVKHQYKSKINTRQTSIQVKDQYTSNINTSQRSIHVKHKYKSNINTRQSFLCKTYLYNLYVARLVYRLTVCSKRGYMRELVYYIIIIIILGIYYMLFLQSPRST